MGSLLCKDVKGIKIDGSNKAYGGYIQSAEVSINYTSQSKCTVTIASENGEYSSKASDLSVEGEPHKITFGNMEFKGYLVKRGTSESGSGKLLKLSYVDESSVWLDKHIVVLRNHISEEGQAFANSRFIKLGKALRFSFTDSSGNYTYPIGHIKFSDTLLNQEVENSTYSFKELINELPCTVSNSLRTFAEDFENSFDLEKTINFSKILKNDDLNSPCDPTGGDDEFEIPYDAISEDLLLRSKEMGTLREVLNSFSAKFGVMIYWNPFKNELDYFDMREGVTSEEARQEYERQIASKCAVEVNESDSIEDCFSHGSLLTSVFNYSAVRCVHGVDKFQALDLRGSPMFIRGDGVRDNAGNEDSVGFKNFLRASSISPEFYQAFIMWTVLATETENLEIEAANSYTIGVSDIPANSLPFGGVNDTDADRTLFKKFYPNGLMEVKKVAYVTDHETQKNDETLSYYARDMIKYLEEEEKNFVKNNNTYMIGSVSFSNTDFGNSFISGEDSIYKSCQLFAKYHGRFMYASKKRYNYLQDRQFERDLNTWVAGQSVAETDLADLWAHIAGNKAKSGTTVESFLESVPDGTQGNDAGWKVEVNDSPFDNELIKNEVGGNTNFSADGGKNARSSKTFQAANDPDSTTDDPYTDIIPFVDMGNINNNTLVNPPTIIWLQKKIDGNEDSYLFAISGNGTPFANISDYASPRTGEMNDIYLSFIEQGPRIKTTEKKFKEELEDMFNEKIIENKVVLGGQPTVTRLGITPSTSILNYSLDEPAFNGEVELKDDDFEIHNSRTVEGISISISPDGGITSRINIGSKRKTDAIRNIAAQLDAYNKGGEFFENGRMYNRDWDSLGPKVRNWMGK